MESNTIKAIIIDGRHGGKVLSMRYLPQISLSIEDESQISMGEDYDGSVKIGDQVEYYECFRSVDKLCVLYSTNGSHEDIRNIHDTFRQTFPIPLF